MPKFYTLKPYKFMKLQINYLLLHLTILFHNLVTLSPKMALLSDYLPFKVYCHVKIYSCKPERFVSKIQRNVTPCYT